MPEVSGGQPAVDAQNLWALQRMHQFQPSEWVSRINCSTTTGWFNKSLENSMSCPRHETQAFEDAEILQSEALGGSMLRVWPHQWDTVRTTGHPSSSVVFACLLHVYGWYTFDIISSKIQR